MQLILKLAVVILFYGHVSHAYITWIAPRLWLQVTHAFYRHVARIRLTYFSKAESTGTHSMTPIYCDCRHHRPHRDRPGLCRTNGCRPVTSWPLINLRFVCRHHCRHVIYWRQPWSATQPGWCWIVMQCHQRALRWLMNCSLISQRPWTATTCTQKMAWTKAVSISYSVSSRMGQLHIHVHVHDFCTT